MLVYLMKTRGGGVPFFENGAPRLWGIVSESLFRLA
jgi:hypothetical protein